MKVCRRHRALRAPAKPYSEWYLATKATPGAGDSILIDSFSADPSPKGDFDYTVPVAGSFHLSAGDAHLQPTATGCSPRATAPSTGHGVRAGPARRMGGRHHARRRALRGRVARSRPGLRSITTSSSLVTITAAREPCNFRLVHLTTSAQTSGWATCSTSRASSRSTERRCRPTRRRASRKGSPRSTRSSTSTTCSRTPRPTATRSSRRPAASPRSTATPTTCSRAMRAPSSTSRAGGPVRHARHRGQHQVRRHRQTSTTVRPTSASGTASSTGRNLGPATDPVITTTVTARQIIYNAYPSRTELGVRATTCPSPGKTRWCT